jgi:hypothetical protein
MDREKNLKNLKNLKSLKINNKKINSRIRIDGTSVCTDALTQPRGLRNIFILFYFFPRSCGSDQPLALCVDALKSLCRRSFFFFFPHPCGRGNLSTR